MLAVGVAYLGHAANSSADVVWLQHRVAELEAQAATSADGSAWSDYFWLDAPPHEALTLQADLVRSGMPAGWVDVYLRFGEWPTTQLTTRA